MLITTRYLLKNLLAVTVFIALTLTMVIWLAQSLRFLELIATTDAPPGLLLKLVGLSLPKFLEIVIPISLVAAILFVYHKFIMDNELIVMRACGMDNMVLARPALIIAGTITALMLLLTTWLSPAAHAQMQNLRQIIKAEYSALMLREGVFNTFGDELTVYLRDRQENGELSGLLIHDTRDKDTPPVTITAKKGAMVMIEDSPSIVVYEGMRQQFDPKTKSVNRLFFDRYTIEVRAFQPDVRVRWREADERTFFELLNPDPTVKNDLQNRDAFIAAAHIRLLSPFNTLSFTLISLACLFLGSYNRRGQSRKILMAVVLVLLLQVSLMGLGNLAKNNLLIIPALYIATLLPLVIAYHSLEFTGEMRLRRLLRLLPMGRA